LVLLIGLFLACPALAGDAAPGASDTRTIAITFDDSPRRATGYFSGPERAERLIVSLRTAGVTQAVFFCNTSQFDEEGRARVLAFAKAGHLLANHTHSHPDLHRVGSQDFIADALRADAVLRGLPGTRKWLRFPYLREGATLADRDAVRAWMRESGYRPGYVTVDNYDWYLESLFQQAVAAGRTIDFDQLRDAYVEILADAVEFYDGIAQTALGRSPAHVLLLHETDLAALFIDELVASLRQRGWRIVTADEAYADPIASEEPKTLLLGQGRVVALAIDRGYQGPRGLLEDEAEIKAELERRGVWK
jgi:peptidoglycan/xylan/chitin deacetylase (PgdA/CDA1 family)